MTAFSSNPENSAPPDARFFIRLGAVVILIVFGGSLLWSLAAPIQGAVIANGRIVVEGNRKAVQHLEGGVIGEIFVREGQRVESGEVLARLDDVTQNASLALIDGQLTELYARRARLEAERDGAAKISPPRGGADILASPQFAEKAAGQRQLFEARKQSYSTQIELLNERVVQQNERIAGLRARIKSLGDQRRLIVDELEGVRELYEQGFAPLTRLRALEREEKRLAGESGALRAGIAEAHSIIAEAALEIERLRDANREQAITELRDVEVSIVELEERRIAALDSLRRTEIRAPQGGVVLNLAIHTEGGVIAPGADIMEIVPEGGKLQVAARVAPKDIDKVRQGQETLVRFTAFGARLTPEAIGEVETVSADSLVDETTGAPYYLVLVTLPETQELSALFEGRALVPGMPVEAFIRTSARPAISYFLKPLTDTLARSMRDD